MGEESNGELAFLDTLLKLNNGKPSVLVSREPTHTDQSCTTALATKEVVRKVLFLPCSIEHIPLSQTKMTYTKKTLEQSKY